MLKRSLTRLRLLRGAGILLVTLGVVHLVATPHIATLVRDSASPASARWLTPPMLLNHILVGVPDSSRLSHDVRCSVCRERCILGAGCRADHRALGCDLAGRSLRADGDALLFRRATLCLGRSSDCYCRRYIVGCCVRPMSLAHQASSKVMQRTASHPAIYFLGVCHPPYGCVTRFTGLAVADLVSR